MPNPRPDFAQFAERCKERAALHSNPTLQAHELTAERHARLLQTIQKWANSPDEWAKAPTDFALAEQNALGHCKAHIRSLLEQG